MSEPCGKGERSGVVPRTDRSDVFTFEEVVGSHRKIEE